MSKTCMRSRQRCRRSKTMRANLPPRLSPSVEPPSNGMKLQQRQRYVPYTHERNYACRITECTFRGLRSVILENQIIRISVAADKGADMYEFLHKPTDTEFLLRTPLGLRSQPPVLPTINLREGSFSDFYDGKLFRDTRERRAVGRNSWRAITIHCVCGNQRGVHSSRISRPRICAGPRDVPRSSDSGSGKDSFSSRQVLEWRKSGLSKNWIPFTCRNMPNRDFPPLKAWSVRNVSSR